MFFNKLKQTSVNVFNKGRDLIKKVPEFIAKGVEYAGKVSKYANQANKKIDDIEKVYQNTSKYQSPEVADKIGKAIQGSRQVSGQIQRTAEAVGDIGRQVQPLF